MESIEHIFNTLAGAFGPVGALFVIIAAYLAKRLFAIQDKQIDSAIADAKLEADRINAFNNMRTAFDSLTAELKARK